MTEADLEAADFREANLQGASLRGADLTRARLVGATLTYADFRVNTFLVNRPTRGLTREMLVAAKNWRFAFYSPDMLKKLGLPPDHNEKLQKQMDAELKQAQSAATTPATPK